MKNSSNTNLRSSVEKTRETQMTGTIGFKVYKSYFMAVESKMTLIWVTLIFILTQIAVSGVDYLVKSW